MIEERFHFLRVPKLCPKCGKEIPANGYETNEKGEVIVDEKGHGIWRDRALLVCETCATNAAPPPPKRKRRKPGEPLNPDQMTIDAPMIKYK